MTILVTGASGFLGSHIVQRLTDEGHTVRALVRPSSDVSRLVVPVELAYGDLNDELSLRQACQSVTTIIHCAARVSEHGTRQQFIAENLTATETLLHSAQRQGVKRFIYISSPSVVMDRHDPPQLGITEQKPYPEHFLNLYSETKAAAEQRVLQANSSTFTTCALRPRAIWGPGDTTGPLINILIRLEQGKLPDLSGDRPVLTSLCYVDNAVEAVMLAIQSNQVGGKAYFVVDKEVTNVWEYLPRVAHEFNIPVRMRRVNPRLIMAVARFIDSVWRIPIITRCWDPPITSYAVALLTRSTTYDTTAAQRDFGYVPIMKREAGMQCFLIWWKNWRREKDVRSSS